MTKIVDHTKRKTQILQKSLDLFALMGYPQVTYQQIADACGIPRTGLYRYFHTKREIFDAALAQLVAMMSTNVRETVRAKNLASAGERLELVLSRSVELCLMNPALMRAVFEYLHAQVHQGEEVERKIRRHTAPLRWAIRKLLAEGIENGEFVPVDIIQGEDLIFSLIQAVAMRIMFYQKNDKDALLKHCKSILKFLRKNKA